MDEEVNNRQEGRVIKHHKLDEAEQHPRDSTGMRIQHHAISSLPKIEVSVGCSIVGLRNTKKLESDTAQTSL